MGYDPKSKSQCPISIYLYTASQASTHTAPPPSASPTQNPTSTDIPSTPPVGRAPQASSRPTPPCPANHQATAPSLPRPNATPRSP
ncbi:hypothetical protein MFRU_004g02380 [Monilinia fructicola]|nr:hypothetical protein MFRU_004g02380 [Monilinia fructicola]